MASSTRDKKYFGMKQKIALGVILLLLAFMVIVFTQSDQPAINAGNSNPLPQQPSSNVVPTGNSQGIADSQQFNPATTLSVDILDDSFDPSVVQIGVGDTITWTNTVRTEHSVKADSFSSGNLRNGETFSYQFPTAGTYDYACGLHSDMAGQIIVK